MDNISTNKRSWNMSRIKSRNTGPERKVRSILHAFGYRFRLHSGKLPGSPDIVLPKYKTTIFVHGCFWHRHGGCKSAYIPKSRTEFWMNKFRENTQRDLRSQEALKHMGWNVFIIWECQTKNINNLAEIITQYFKSL